MTTAVPPYRHLEWDRAQRLAFAVGIGGLVLFFLGSLLTWGHWAVTFRSYLVAWTFWLGIALGCLAVLMLHYLVRGTWGIVLRRMLEAGMLTLPLLFVTFLPIAFGLPLLYSWVRSNDPALSEKQMYYLNAPFFLIRAIIYFAVWFVLAIIFGRLSRRQDETPQPVPTLRMRLLSGPGLILYGITITFASIDWVMSLEPHFYSSIYPLIFSMGQVLSAFAFTIAAVIVLADVPPLNRIVIPDHLRDLGSLLLTFVMIWAYMEFSQLLIVWSGNLPEEVSWYVKRLQGGWQWFALVLLLFQFVLPFLLLLSSDIKKNGRTLLVVAIVVLVMRWFDMFWMIVPAHIDAEESTSMSFWRHW
ncbi:MAG TPA: hypothetical protein VGZ47_05835, partial [Gemmataceae bacterium]|nr:hypothetical protein [Gemmataceae bacterium]